MTRSNLNTEAWVQSNARGLYRWEAENGELYAWGECPYFEEGDAITIDPFRDKSPDSEALWPVYGTFIEYVTEDIAKVYIPPEGNEDVPTWFREGEGEYLIHEGYLTPQ